MRTKYSGKCACGREIEASLELPAATSPPVHVWIGCTNKGGHEKNVVYDLRLSRA